MTEIERVEHALGEIVRRRRRLRRRDPAAAVEHHAIGEGAADVDTDEKITISHDFVFVVPGRGTTAYRLVPSNSNASCSIRARNRGTLPVNAIAFLLVNAPDSAAHPVASKVAHDRRHRPSCIRDKCAWRSARRWYRH